MPNVFSNPYQLDESISNFRGVGGYFSLLFKNLKETSVCLQNVLLKFETNEKLPLNTPKIGNEIALLIRVGMSIRL